MFVVGFTVRASVNSYCRMQRDCLFRSFTLDVPIYFFFFLPVGSTAHALCGGRLYLHVTMLPINLVDRDACTIILLLCCCVIVL